MYNHSIYYVEAMMYIQNIPIDIGWEGCIVMNISFIYNQHIWMFPKIVVAPHHPF